jgi:hypothetical protein
MRWIALLLVLLGASPALAQQRFRAVREAWSGAEAVRLATELPQVRHALRQGRTLTLALRLPNGDDVGGGQRRSASLGGWASGGRLVALDLVPGTAGRVQAVVRTQELSLKGGRPLGFLSSAELARHAVPHGTPTLTMDAASGSGWEFRWAPARVSPILFPARELLDKLDFGTRLTITMKPYVYFPGLSGATVADGLERALPSAAR